VEDDLTEVHDVVEHDYEDFDDDHLEVHLQVVASDDFEVEDFEVGELDENDKIKIPNSKIK
jgi:hypothetical protein